MPTIELLCFMALIPPSIVGGLSICSAFRRGCATIDRLNNERKTLAEMLWMCGGEIHVREICPDLVEQIVAEEARADADAYLAKAFSI